MHRGCRGSGWRSWAACNGRAGTRSHPGTQYLHARLWSENPDERLRAAPFSVVIDDPPVDELTAQYPIRLTTGRRLDSYNTGVQTGSYSSPLRRPEAIELSHEDAEALGLTEGEQALVSSRRGEVVAPVHVTTRPATGARVHDHALPR